MSGPTVYVVVTEWDGPGYRNPGDAPVSVIEGVAANEADAEEIKRKAIAENEQFGHEHFNGENDQTWDFCCDVRPMPLGAVR